MSSWTQLCCARLLHRGVLSGRYGSDGRIAKCPRSAATSVGAAVNDGTFKIDCPIDHCASRRRRRSVVRRGCCEAASIGVGPGSDRNSHITRFGCTRLAATYIEQRSRHRPDHDPPAAGRSTGVRQRAAERRMKDSAYIAALVRGHVAANPPLATHELAAFKVAVSVLAEFGRASGADGKGSGAASRRPAPGSTARAQPYSSSRSGRGAAHARIRPSGARNLGEPR